MCGLCLCPGCTRRLKILSNGGTGGVRLVDRLGGQKSVENFVRFTSDVGGRHACDFAPQANLVLKDGLDSGDIAAATIGSDIGGARHTIHNFQV